MAFPLLEHRDAFRHVECFSIELQAQAFGKGLGVRFAAKGAGTRGELVSWHVADIVSGAAEPAPGQKDRGGRIDIRKLSCL